MRPKNDNCKEEMLMSPGKKVKNAEKEVKTIKTEIKRHKEEIESEESRKLANTKMETIKLKEENLVELSAVLSPCIAVADPWLFVEVDCLPRFMSCIFCCKVTKLETTKSFHPSDGSNLVYTVLNFH